MELRIRWGDKGVG